MIDLWALRYKAGGRGRNLGRRAGTSVTRFYARARAVLARRRRFSAAMIAEDLIMGPHIKAAR
jgi:hypothetical protein